MQEIRKDFLPADLLPLLNENQVTGTVAVQAEQSDAETEFLLNLANEHDFIKAIVGWTDFFSEHLEDKLHYYKKNDKLKGFRHILQAEEPDYMLQPDFLKGIGLLQKFGLTYDILVYPHHLPEVINLVNRYPKQLFVIDHIAKPRIKKQEIQDWKINMKLLAAYDNVYCKLSGMVTEANWKHWEQQDFTPYLDTVTNEFGTNRIMYGSDWPVCLVAASYGECIGIVKQYFKSFSDSEQQKIFGLNAAKFYRI
jgi:L-fuconolactonase